MGPQDLPKGPLLGVFPLHNCIFGFNYWYQRFPHKIHYSLSQVHRGNFFQGEYSLKQSYSLKTCRTRPNVYRCDRGYDSQDSLVFSVITFLKLNRHRIASQLPLILKQSWNECRICQTEDIKFFSNRAMLLTFKKSWLEIL